MALDILIVDDERDIRELISGILEDEGFEARTAHDSETALFEVEKRLPSLVIQDIWLQNSKRDGLEVLKILKNRHKNLPIIMISGHGNIETAVASIKLGAYDYIEKPFQTGKLLHLVYRATETERLRRENEDLRQKAGFVQDLAGTSPVVAHLRQMINKIAPTNSRVLINGPTGAGKEVVARLIHQNSERAGGVFLIINAASIRPDNMEQELFGVEQNGKVVKTGLFERAHGGTFLLDKIDEMPMPTQAKILRVLTDQCFYRVGGTKEVQVDVRVISTAGEDLKKAIRNGTFREDLYHRLNVVSIDVLPLSEHREDIPVLVEKFLISASAATGYPKKAVSVDALATLQAYDWPGNIRELKNLIERLLILSHGTGQEDCEAITADIIPGEIKGKAPGTGTSETDIQMMFNSLKDARQVFERDYIRFHLSRFSGNVSRTAEFIGMERSALHRKLKLLGLSVYSRVQVKVWVDKKGDGAQIEVKTRSG
ncbi:MAG: sigma-54-dependent Fis family transcriptional regulator [Proteobacteria bacterium]|nr:sigma-54-dependent Fis family transcriptional regulator [Pseudomonadota bacterium]